MRIAHFDRMADLIELLDMRIPLMVGICHLVPISYCTSDVMTHKVHAVSILNGVPKNQLPKHECLLMREQIKTITILCFISCCSVLMQNFSTIICTKNLGGGASSSVLPYTKCSGPEGMCLFLSHITFGKSKLCNLPYLLVFKQFVF